MDLSCPHCGLRLPMDGPRHEYCPRCIANRGQPVPLIASSLFKHREETGADAVEVSAAKPGPALRPRHAF
jgi:hypothetical protein